MSAASEAFGFSHHLSPSIISGDNLRRRLHDDGVITEPFSSSSQDFLLMFIHHLATVSLISFSYVNNMVRVGSLVMCIHDASDFLLEVGGHSLRQYLTCFSCINFIFLRVLWLEKDILFLFPL